MATLTDLKARFLEAVTGKRNRVDAEMAYYGMAATGAIPVVDTTALPDSILTWDAGTSSWVALPLVDYLAALPGWNAGVAQALQHDAAGDLVWVAA